jgi:hypothetical protein
MKIVPRCRFVFLFAAIAVALAAAPAAASWRASAGGVEYGWTDSYWRQNDYAWARASDAALARLGASVATSLACRAATEDVPRLTYLCGRLVKPWISWWIGTEAAWLNHGHWVAFYPFVPSLSHGSW